jgi:hypothetical protein
MTKISEGNIVSPFDNISRTDNSLKKEPAIPLLE